MTRIPAGALLALFAAACAAPLATYYGADTSALYSRVTVSSAGSQGPVPLLVRGTPFAGVDAQRLAAATAAGISRSPAAAPMRLTTGDPGPRDVDYRVIVAFGEARVGVNGLCAAPDAALVPSDRLTATAAFCIGDRLVSTARGRLLEAADSPEGPVFQGFLEGLAGALLPTTNANLRSCGFGRVC